jgi:competence ComEA-like helix-hairpin-helix protein
MPATHYSVQSEGPRIILHRVLEFFTLVGIRESCIIIQSVGGGFRKGVDEMRIKQILARLLYSLLCIAVLGQNVTGTCGVDTVALRCWKCGELFIVPVDCVKPRCPSCGSICKRSKSPGKLAIHCLRGDSGCSFVLCCPDGTTVAFVASRAGDRMSVADYLKGIGIVEVGVLIGARSSDGCVKSMTEIMKSCLVGQLFDPGFKNDGKLYADFLIELRKSETKYRVVRGAENFSLGNVRFYLIRPSSFNAGVSDEDELCLGVVHGSNSFLLSRGLRGGGLSPEPLPSAESVSGELLYLQGFTESFRAVASPVGGRDPVVVSSDSREMSVKSLRRILLSPVSPENSLRIGAQSGKDAVPRISTAPAKGERKVNINTAGADELKSLSGIGIKRAQGIIEYRKKNGPYRNIEEIKNVSGIGDKIFQRNKDCICVR